MTYFPDCVVRVHLLDLFFSFRFIERDCMEVKSLDSSPLNLWTRKTTWGYDMWVYI